MTNEPTLKDGTPVEEGMFIDNGSAAYFVEWINSTVYMRRIAYLRGQWDYNIAAELQTRMPCELREFSLHKVERTRLQDAAEEAMHPYQEIIGVLLHGRDND
jgi:hypothetical protein